MLKLGDLACYDPNHNEYKYFGIVQRIAEGARGPIVVVDAWYRLTPKAYLLRYAFKGNVNIKDCRKATAEEQKIWDEYAVPKLILERI